jgi:hypothetical protein
MSNYKNGGLDNKYIITKKNGNPVDPNAVYFVLRLDKDPHALNAIETYMKSVSKDNKELAEDLSKMISNIIQN